MSGWQGGNRGIEKVMQTRIKPLKEDTKNKKKVTTITGRSNNLVTNVRPTLN